MIVRMSGEGAREVLTWLEAADVAVWVAGGWGVDALLGRETRPHGDLDLAIDAAALDLARKALEERGFRHDEASRPGMPARFVMRDRRGRAVDFHPLFFDATGDGWQQLSESGKAWGHHPAGDLAATGSIEGVAVRCISASLQVRFRMGYEWSDRDEHDLRLLAERFGVRVPPPIGRADDAGRRPPAVGDDGSPRSGDAREAVRPSELNAFTVAERPDLAEPGWERTRDVIPEYNNHGDVLNRYWPRLTGERPDFQFHVASASGEIFARACSIPVRWDGTVEDLPRGIDGAIARGFDEGGANALCALVIMVPRDLQGRGMSGVALRAMVDLARRHSLEALIAPVRPSWKERYPLVPIERYMTWRRSDGLLFDPWMRVHERLGAAMLKPEPRSLKITGTVAEWEEWTGMSFPDSGDYCFPGGLTTLTIDRGADRGSYWEPNVWMRHRV
jgi:hypothetical protein